MTSIRVKSPTAGTRLANIGELIGNIFIHLDYFDLLRVQRVCQRWRSYVLEVKELQPLLYKAPITLAGNAHFEPIDATLTTFQLADGKLFVESLETSDVEWYMGLMSSLASMPEQSLRQHLGACTSQRYNIHHDLEGQLGEKNTWPERLSTLCCENCDHVHKVFRYDHLHPILRFLESIPFICFDGYGDAICVNIYYFEPNNVDDNYLYAFFDNAVRLCIKLNDIYTTTQDLNMKNDYCIQPTASLFSIRFRLQRKKSAVFFAVQNTGLQLGELLRELIKCCRKMLQHVLGFAKDNANISQPMDGPTLVANSPCQVIESKQLTRGDGTKIEDMQDMWDHLADTMVFWKDAAKVEDRYRGAST